MKKEAIQLILFFLILIILFILYRKGAFVNIFRTKSQREAFYNKLKRTDETLAAQWLQAGEEALKAAVGVPSAYSERATFHSVTQATALSFSMIPGRKIGIEIKNKGNKKIFVDLFEKDSTGLKNLVEADTTAKILQTKSVFGGKYIVRLQPQPGYLGSYDFSLSSGPLISWPIKAGVASNIGSFWGANRDGGRRSHQGVDIFAKKGSLLVAAADGYVTRVGDNTLGGKVIFLRPDELPVSLYYAHLDSQMIEAETRVKTGDVIGTVGNTGNAQNTPPHLHFGVYARGGAVDPTGFLLKASLPSNRNTSLPVNLKKVVTKRLRLFPTPDLKVPAQIIQKNDSIFVIAATGDFYRVQTKEGKRGYLRRNDF